MKKKIINILTNIILILALIGLTISGFLLYKEYIHLKEIKQAHNNIINLVMPTVQEETALSFTKASWDKLKETNADFYCWLEFDSGLIKEPVMLTGEHSKYLRTSFDMAYSGLGTPFIDQEYHEGAQNIMIYGHNMLYGDDTLMFSPLKKLSDPQFYEDNKTFKLYFENEVRSYIILKEYYYNVYTDGAYDYTMPDLATTQQTFNEWRETPDSRSTISPTTPTKASDILPSFTFSEEAIQLIKDTYDSREQGEYLVKNLQVDKLANTLTIKSPLAKDTILDTNLTEDGYYVTFQTCATDADNGGRTIVVAKEFDRRPYLGYGESALGLEDTVNTEVNTSTNTEVSGGN